MELGAFDNEKLREIEQFTVLVMWDLPVETDGWIIDYTTAWSRNDMRRKSTRLSSIHVNVLARYEPRQTMSSPLRAHNRQHVPVTSDCIDVVSNAQTKLTAALELGHFVQLVLAKTLL